MDRTAMSKAQGAVRVAPQKVRPLRKKAGGLAGSQLARESLVSSAQRLSLDLSRFVTREKAVPSSDKYSSRYKQAPAVRIHVSDTDPGLSFAPAFSDSQLSRFQRVAFDPKFAKPVMEAADGTEYSPAEEIEGSGYSIAYLRQRKTRRERVCPWWLDEDERIFQRLVDHWIAEAGNDQRLIDKAALDRDLLTEWYHAGLSDADLLKKHETRFASIRKASLRVRTATALRAYRHRLLKVGYSFFADPGAPPPPLKPGLDPTYLDRRQRRERWRDIREGPDRFKKGVN
jgi:hypothetical protein